MGLTLVAAGALVAARRRSRRPFDLEGRTALVTGGSRGLGLAIAHELGARGARVAICGRDGEALSRARAQLAEDGISVLALECDVADRSSVQHLVRAVTERLGPVEILVNDAGIIEVGPALTMTIDDYREAMATNFWGTLHTTLEVLPSMTARRTGRIVNITSIGGKIAVPHLLPYSASKFAAVGFSEGLRAELSGNGVKVVTVVPGLMRTGSPRNATFRGKQRAEYAWFSIADSLPGLSISAAEAARRIVRGAVRGDAHVVFPLTTRAALFMNGVAPQLAGAVAGVAGRLLPGLPAADTGRKAGRESSSALSPSVLTSAGDQAALRYNQVAPAEAP
jgi:NAD(P)-dependent dehydrogenase (short-subunit alcohol dehydrogenase family)